MNNTPNSTEIDTAMCMGMLLLRKDTESRWAASEINRLRAELAAVRRKNDDLSIALDKLTDCYEDLADQRNRLAMKPWNRLCSALAAFWKRESNV